MKGERELKEREREREYYNDGSTKEAEMGRLLTKKARMHESGI